MLSYQLTESDLGQRADHLAVTVWPKLTRSAIKRIAAQKQFFFDDQPILVGRTLSKIGVLKINDSLLSAAVSLPKVELDIIYQDQDFLIIDKPSGIISHGRSLRDDQVSIASSARDFLESGFLKASDEDGAGFRAGLAHRLDQDTSGIMVIAKNQGTLASIQSQFKNRLVKKRYLAIVENNSVGQKLPDLGLIDKPIRRSRRQRQLAKFKVDLRGRPAQTKFAKTDIVTNDYLQLEVWPLTGRTHQIRIHLSSLRCPIVGDRIYGGKAASRLFLHANQLQFKHPRTGLDCQYEAKVPDSFSQLMGLK